MFSYLNDALASAATAAASAAAAYVPGAKVHDEETEAARARFDDELSKGLSAASLAGPPGASGAAPHPHDDKAIQEAKDSMWNLAAVREYVGADVLSLLSVPVFIMEPVTMLQKMAEVLEYSELLDAAAAADDPVERMAHIAAFLVSPFGCCERAWKPFNPLLGETFELEGLGPAKDGRFFAEQVTVSPPVGAAHAECGRWTYDIVSAPKTRFLGNSLEVFPNGRTRIALPGRGETYTHVPPHVKVHNVVLGRTWIDVEGDFYVFCPESGVRCDLKFTPCGWFNAGRYEFEGHVTGADGAKALHISGLWSAHVDAAACGPDGEPLPDAARRRLWGCRAKPEGDHYGFTAFARRLNTCAGLRRPPLPSDSRRRADREALVGRHLPRAGAEQTRLEEGAKAEAAHREAGGAAFAPRWFDAAPGMELLPGEMAAEEVPLYSWRPGGFDALEAALAGGGAAGQQQQEEAPAQQGQQQAVADAGVLGHGFAPWAFPELHKHEAPAAEH